MFFVTLNLMASTVFLGSLCSALITVISGVYPATASLTQLAEFLLMILERFLRGKPGSTFLAVVLKNNNSYMSVTPALFVLVIFFDNQLLSTLQAMRLKN